MSANKDGDRRDDGVERSPEVERLIFDGNDPRQNPYYPLPVFSRVRDDPRGAWEPPDPGERGVVLRGIEDNGSGYAYNDQRRNYEYLVSDTYVHAEALYRDEVPRIGRGVEHGRDRGSA